MRFRNATVCCFCLHDDLGELERMDDMQLGNLQGYLLQESGWLCVQPEGCVERRDGMDDEPALIPRFS